MAAAKFYHARHEWHLRIRLARPDHLHLLSSFPKDQSMTSVVGNWKRYLSRECGMRWQRDFFDHRLRDSDNAEEKLHYIQMNPVRSGLVTSPEDWPLRMDV